MFSEQTERRCMAFVRTVANDCAYCMRRSSENCGNCRSVWAKSILKDMENDRDGNSKYVDYSIGARITNILLILKTANRPIPSSEINLDGICSPQLKMWTINRLVARGLVKRKRNVFGDTRRFLYFLNPRKSIGETK